MRGKNMTEKTIYIANDGTEFNTFMDCFDYENYNDIIKFKDTALLFDKNYNQINLNDIGNYSFIYYIKALTDEAAQFLEKFLDDYNNPWNQEKPYSVKAGIWAFSGGYWYSKKNLEACINGLQKIYTKAFE